MAGRMRGLSASLTEMKTVPASGNAHAGAKLALGEGHVVASGRGP